MRPKKRSLPPSESIVVHNQLVVVLQSLGAHGHPLEFPLFHLYGCFHPRELSSGANTAGVVALGTQCRCILNSRTKKEMMVAAGAMLL